MEASPQRQGPGGHRHPLGGVRAAEKSVPAHSGRGAGGELQVGEHPTLPRPGCGQVPLRAGERPAGVGVCHPSGGDHVQRPGGGLSPIYPHPAVQPESPAPGPHRGPEGGTAGGQRGSGQRPAGPGNWGQPDPRGADHPASQPPGSQPYGVLRGVRRGAPVSPVLSKAHLSLGQRAAHVPLLRLLTAPAPRLPRLRREAQLHRRGHPAGAGGAGGAFSRSGGAADGLRHRHRRPLPREDFGAVPFRQGSHPVGHPDGGQGIGF